MNVTTLNAIVSPELQEYNPGTEQQLIPTLRLDFDSFVRTANLSEI